MAQILDQWGNPVRSQALVQDAMGPTVTGIRATFDEFIASGLTPAKMSRILRDAATGDMQDFLTLAEEMEERETQYGSVLGTRKRAIQSIEPVVKAAADDREAVKIADAVHERIIENLDLDDFIGDALDGLGKGYSVNETQWEMDAREWQPARLEWHDPRLFQFDRETRKQLRKRVLGGFDGAPLEPFKFIVHQPRLKSGIPARNGLARLAMWVFLLKSYSLKDWAAFLEVHGMPLRLGKYGAGASTDDKRVLLRAVRDLGADAAAIIPKEMEIEFVETKGFSEKPFEGFAVYLDKALSKAIIGQTMSADEGASGGLAQARVQENVRADIWKADARQLAATINRDLIRPFVDLNFGPQARYPKFVFPIAEPEDVKSMADALQKLVPLGLKVQSSEVRDKMGFAEPDEGAEVLGAPAAQPESQPRGRERQTPPAKAVNSAGQDDEDDPAPHSLRFKGCPCCGALPRALNAAALDPEDEQDQLVAAAMEEWEPDMAPIVDLVKQAAAGADNYEAFEAALDRLSGTLPTGDLAARIAIQTMKARGLGEAGDGTPS